MMANALARHPKKTVLPQVFYQQLSYYAVKYPEQMPPIDDLLNKLSSAG